VSLGQASPIYAAESDLYTVASPIDHPECVAWYGGEVYCGTEGGALLAIDPATGAVRTVAETGGSLLGIAFAGDGSCFACDRGRGRVLRISPDGQVESLAEQVEGRRLVTPNYPAFDADGRLWVTESGSGFRAGDGYLFRLRPGSEPELIDDACRNYPNGLAFSADGSRLYVVESSRPGIVSYRLEGDRLGEREEALPLPRMVPDGLAFDLAGRLYVAVWRPDCVLRWDPAGAEPELLLEDWTAEYLPTPTNICFGGDGLQTLYFGSYSGWSITALDEEGPGLSLPPRGDQ
jgi:sugar lactone lactonase YvrE